MDVPDRIAHYRIVRPLGEGGMAQVYLAEDTRLRRFVALKLLRREGSADESRVSRFQQEVRAISALNHPNILTIYDIGSEAGTDYIATEYVDGETLREIMNRRRLSVGEILDIAVAVCEALAAAHEVWIVHRDVKPENVMIRRDGYLKVLDFGLAELVREPLEPSTREEGFWSSTDVMGTTHYMAPEQILGLEPDARSDIFSLGVMLYELVAGSAPFDGHTRGEVAKKILENEAPPIKQGLSDVPRDLERIIFRALSKDRMERYQSVRDVLADLRRVSTDMEFKRQHQRIFRSSDRLPGRRREAADSSAAGRRIALEEEGASQPGMRHQTFLILALVVALLSVVALIWVQQDSTPPVQSVAVMPFTNTSGEPEAEYVAEGVADEIIETLSRFSGLRVVARASAFRYRNRPGSPRIAGRDMGVDAVVIGDVSEADEVLKIDVQLLDVRSGESLWQRNYRRRADAAATLQGEIAVDLAEAIGALPAGAVAASTASANPEAYRLYLKGRYYWNRRTAEGFRLATEFFRKAIDQDPTYAEAYAGLADSYNLLGSYGNLAPTDAFPRAKAAALRAIELNPDLAEAHASLAYVLQNYDWDWDAADREYRRAIELSPNYATAHHWYGGFLMLMGRFDEAIMHRRRAAELDPLSPQISASVGSPYLLSRQYPAAIEFYEKAIEMDPNYSRGHFALGWAHLHSGNVEAGVRHIEIAHRLSGDRPEAQADLAYAYARAGKMDQAKAILEELNRRARREYISPFEFARVYTAVGDHDAAFRELEKAFRQRSNLLIGIKVDPSLDPLRGDPRFDSLMQRMGLDDPPPAQAPARTAQLSGS